MAIKYSKDHLSILTKLVKHCTRKTEAEISEQSKLTCPENVLHLNVMKQVKNCNAEPAMMTAEDNEYYRELMDEGCPIDSYHDFGV